LCDESFFALTSFFFAVLVRTVSHFVNFSVWLYAERFFASEANEDNII